MTLLLLLTLFLAGLLVGTLLTWGGARLAKATRARFGWSFLAILACSLLGLATTFATLWVQPRDHSALFLFVGGLMVVDFVLACLVLRAILGTTLAGAACVWAIQFVGGFAWAALVVFLSVRWLFEAFIIPSNNMAPTLIGWHRQAECPHCGGKQAVPAEPGVPPHFMDRLGICTACQRSGEPKRIEDRVSEPDRLICNKLLAPQRWDLVVFRYPPEPSTKYVMRLVALPGESLTIKDGGIWIDGKRLEPPAELKGLRWLDRMLSGEPVTHGTEEEPLKLGQGEYGVLGDFTEMSSDSRFWGTVPAANIEGVGALTYWPPSRWKLHR